MKNGPLSKIVPITFQESRTETYWLMSFWRSLSATTHCPADLSLLGHEAPTLRLQKETVKRFCQVWSSQMCVTLLPGDGAELAQSYTGKGHFPAPDWTHRDSGPVAASHGPTQAL